MVMTQFKNLLRVLVVFPVLAGFWAGCGKSSAPTADPQPFQAAIAEYLQQHNMAMALKEIKSGPRVDGRTAKLTASMQHASLGGPAVTWEFRFEQNPDGTWKAVSHQ
jgi:hypothetical protein